jgi:hypothetical protein
MRRFGSILVAVSFLAACSAAGTSQSPSTSLVLATSTPIAPVVTSARPAVTLAPSPDPTPPPPTPNPKPTPTPKPVAGWPTVSLAGIALTGAVEDSPEMDGRLQLSVTLAGLAPGETVSLDAIGTYAIRWACGTSPEPCGEIGCGPSSWGATDGTVNAPARAVAGSDGTATARVELVAAPPARSCPTNPSSPWGTMSERWEQVTVADPGHRLILAPDTIERAVTF